MQSQNIVRISRNQDSNFFFINNIKVLSTEFLPFSGTDIGFGVTGELKIAIDHLLIFQDTEIKIASDIPVNIEKQNLGSNINTPYDEILPVISQDGTTLYFSSRYNAENTGGIKDAEEIWYSTLEASGVWSGAKNVGWPLNNPAPNWVISITPDNNTMLVANLYDTNGIHRGSGISITQRNQNDWIIPKKVIIKNFVHHNNWYNFTMSADRKAILMSIMPDDSYGDNDIYVSFLQQDGKWSKPKNLGSIINSIGPEDTPFLAADGITLYYASGGKPGYGGTDIFMTRRLDDSWSKWTEPVNLGPAINSPGDDGSFTIPASGDYAYLASTENAIGGTDLFRFELPLSLRPNPVVLVYGKVLNSKTGEPLQVDISYHTLKTNNEVGVASSNSITGGYKIILPAGQIYSFLGAKEGFYAISDNLNVDTLKAYKEIERNLYLAPIEVGATIRLNNIFFDFGLSILREESFPELDRAVEFLQTNPNVRIEVSGHTDNVGNDAKNKQLSQDRAKAVADYFISKGIEDKRVIWKGYGKIKSLVPNDSEENRQQNRRVEFTILNN
ncbi:MAG: OmpA family protein [Bacteroidota bacterium]